MSADRDLLTGVLAVRLNLLTKQALAQAMNARKAEPDSTLGEMLVRRGMKREDMDWIDRHVDECLTKHGDARRAIAALSDEDSLPRRMQAEVQAASTVVEPPRFKITRLHARGGLGMVYVADDTELNRQVAIKEMQPEYADDPENRARFRQEAEITGGLEHPGIVPVYSLGKLPDGRPYYAMRFIEGDSLKAAIESYHNSPGTDAGSRLMVFRDLLTRFIDVCNAIAYAHSRGVLHRDLKPGNIMLGKFGETLVVDWGLAKPLEGDPKDWEKPPSLKDTQSFKLSTGSSHDTTSGDAVGTPAFMSPEQADGRISDLTPMSDVYSLGAALYELLCGQAPFKGPTFEVIRKVLDGDFPPPRQVKPEVPAALEAVVLKAMARMPGDRYRNALELAKEISHFLADEPVAAYREPAAVRTRRWIRRHKTAATVAAAVLLVSVAGLSIGLLFVNHEKNLKELARQEESRQRQDAVAARQSESRQRESAQKRLAQIEKANELLGTIFKDLDPRAADREGKPLQALMGERLDQMTAQLEGDAVGDPLTVAKLQVTLGVARMNLGDAPKAVALFTKARATFTDRLGPEHADTLSAINNLALARQHDGKFDLALPLHDEAYRTRRKILGADDPATLTAMNDLAECLREAGKSSEALPLFEEALKFRTAKLGADHPDTLSSMNNLALGYYDEQKRDAALPLFVEALERRKQKLGADHPDTLVSMNNLAGVYYGLGKLDLALPLFAETVNLQRAKLGPEHFLVLTAMHNQAEANRVAGRYAVALPLFAETLRLQRVRRGPEHPETLATMHHYAACLNADGRAEEARPLFEEAVRIARAKFGPDSPTALDIGRSRATFLEAHGDWTKATEARKDLLETERRIRKAGDPRLLSALVAYGICALKADEPATAADALAEALAAREKGDPETWTTFNTRSMLGAALAAQRKFTEAEPMLWSAYEGLKSREDKIPPAIRREMLETALDRMLLLPARDLPRWRAEKAALPTEILPYPKR